MLDLLLSFEGKVAIQLSKLTGEIVDKIGRQGVESSSETIDFSALLNDPNYLNSFDINLGSIENLLIRRKKTVQSGKEGFTNDDFFKEWSIYPNFEINDLGYHINACLVPVLSWEGVSVFNPEAERFEYETDFPVFGTIVSTEPLSSDVTIFIENVGAEYAPFDAPAFENFDFVTPIDPNQNWTLAAGLDGISFELLTTLINDDFPVNQDEGTGFQFDIVDANGTGAVIDLNSDLFDIRIKEISTATSEFSFSQNLSIYPTLATGIVTVESTDTDLKIENIRLVALDSKNVTNFKFDNTNSVKLDISSIESSGYHLLFIKTNKGTTSRKIYTF